VEAREWAERARTGEEVRRIARDADVDPRTVEKHVTRVREVGEREAIRRDLLQRAMEAHQREDLRETAHDLSMGLRRQDVSEAGADRGAPGPLAVAGKRVEALLSHTKGSGLSRRLQEWSELVPRWQTAKAELRNQLSTGVGPWGVNVEGTVEALYTVGALSYARGQAEESPAGYWKPSPDGGLAFGPYQILSGDSEVDRETIKQRFVALYKELAEREVVRELRRVMSQTRELRASIVDLLDDMVMRRYFDGDCPWCPGTRPRMRRSRGGATESLG
jgi:hypothetical protein